MMYSIMRFIGLLSLQFYMVAYINLPALLNVKAVNLINKIYHYSDYTHTDT